MVNTLISDKHKEENTISGMVEKDRKESVGLVGQERFFRREGIIRLGLTRPGTDTEEWRKVANSEMQEKNKEGV